MTTSASEEQPIHVLSESEYPALIVISETLRKFVDWVGRTASLFLVPLILITVFDLALRKTGEFQLFLVENVSGIFGSTLLQEMEWHAHTVVFALVLGYGYIWNTHVRVDLIRENLDFRKKAWIEFIGLGVFFIPFCCILAYFAFIYAYDSYKIGEISASMVGLSHRWIIKSVLFAGIVVAIIAAVAVLLQIGIVLFGPRNIRFPLMTVEWPEDEGGMIEGKVRLDLDKAEDLLATRAAAQAVKNKAERAAGNNTDT